MPDVVHDLVLALARGLVSRQDDRGVAPQRVCAQLHVHKILQLLLKIGTMRFSQFKKQLNISILMTSYDLKQM